MKRWAILLLVFLLLFCVVGCQKKAETPNAGETTEWTPEPPKTLDLSALLTREDVTNALGVTVGEGMLQEHDTVWIFSSEDYATQVSLMVEKPSVSSTEYLRLLASGYPAGSLIEALQLGEKAYWCGDSGELLVAEGDYVLSLGVQCATKDPESRLIAARALALKVLDRL